MLQAWRAHWMMKELDGQARVLAGAAFETAHAQIMWNAAVRRLDGAEQAQFSGIELREKQLRGGVGGEPLVHVP